MGVVAVVFAIGVALGAAVNRWWALPIPPLAWLGYVLGRREGWWGCCGVSEGWWAATVVITVVGAAGFATGVALRRSRRAG